MTGVADRGCDRGCDRGALKKRATGHSRHGSHCTVAPPQSATVRPRWEELPLAPAGYRPTPAPTTSNHRTETSMTDDERAAAWIREILGSDLDRAYGCSRAV
jgi:hypothetical protein